MAKRSGSRGGRDRRSIARSLPRLEPFLQVSRGPHPPKDLRPYEDRRTYTPERRRSLRGFFPLAQRLALAKPLKKSARVGRAAERIRFNIPEAVFVCVRRKRRKEVLFATGKAGRGGGKQRKPRRNEWSDVSCRR